MSCKGGPNFKPEFDGAAEVALLPGTDLRYVVNSQTPIIRVDGADYYGLEAGVWFAAKSLDGPWEVATSVPSLIYTIPTSSPLHYVTYVRIDGSTPEVVYDGYTPGYLGGVESTDGVVVYGTGYDYQPWIGDGWVDTARVGGNRYAGADGKVYRNTGDGWQQHDGGGWRSAGGDTSWADREQQARTQGADRFAGFGGGGFADRFGGGFGDRFGGGFGGGGFGGRFGGGGFGGFRGRR